MPTISRGHGHNWATMKKQRIKIPPEHKIVVRSAGSHIQGLSECAFGAVIFVLSDVIRIFGHYYYSEH